MIDNIGSETVQIFSRLCSFADDYGYDRIDTIDTFCEMFQVLLDSLDIEEYDPNSKKYLS